jgi:hypothetical protein
MSENMVLIPGRYGEGSLEVQITQEGEFYYATWQDYKSTQRFKITGCNPTTDNSGAMLYLCGTKAKLVKPSPVVLAEPIRLRLGNDYVSDDIWDTSIISKRGVYYLVRYEEEWRIIGAEQCPDDSAQLTLERLGKKDEAKVRPSPISNKGEV